MPTIHYIQPDGQRISVGANAGTTLMEAAIRNNVRGIEAECGGSCSCATCHVYVDVAFLDRLPAPDDMEADLLHAVAAARAENSRLGCQVAVTPELDGIVVRIPATQT